ncbi:MULTISPECIES: hypothetical protein [unclassified Streptomyces]|uniref:hypothetical protein n=1 Tax=unclassified Streptomyces TaxID=2593676 RepID=UPI00225B6CE8|nr:MULTISPECIES: hypothetical protein [unclassified Streptomyces]WSP58874.1 hypothetical protein OG306_34260 [Streptomyces sp. NBC_01241]WSU20607.1 hypothetical protein OG508_06075 [Streptomyces sp. NBC_01108]MCX4790603.1 hypothetical protein [Streptomyces sp. NBC_01221]MCX4793668.1 hypothetical protein [Streptomyces sp. NBC_01242]WSJ35096.1 hypothetical protein OG772_02770 [Streptomyces sp. NBC_01321]
MWILLHPHHVEHIVAFLPPVWTKVPVPGHRGVAAAVLAVAFAALVVGTWVRRARFRPFKHPQARTAELVDTSWFVPHALDGFPEEAVRAALETPDTPSLDRLYVAWVLATHTRGVDAAWLERNLALTADAAHLIVEVAESLREEPASQESRDRSAGLLSPSAGRTHGH